MDTMHVFEKHGLGKAPYKFLGVEELRGPITLADGSQVGYYGQPMGCCKYCGTGIAYLFWLESADSKRFYVGSDCIFKSSDAGLKRIIDPIVKAHKAEVAANRSKLLVAMFEDYLKSDPKFFENDKRPHPYSFYASQGKTYGDYNKWIYEHSGFASRAKMARQFLTAANIPLPVTRGKKGTKSGQPLPALVPAHVAGKYGNIKLIDLGD